MGFKVEKVTEQATSVALGETLWLTADEDEVVADGDPRARFLLGGPGTELSVERAAELGLVKAPAKSKSKAEADDADGE